MTTGDLYGGWISPNGDFYCVHQSQKHEEQACEITGGLFPLNDDGNLLPESRYLQISGWVRIVFEFRENYVGVQYVEKLTKYQKEYMECWKQENYEIIDEMISANFPDFQVHAEKDYGFYPYVRFQEKLSIEKLNH